MLLLLLRRNGTNGSHEVRDVSCKTRTARILVPTAYTPRMKRIASLVLLVILAGCRATYHVTMDMEPRNEAAVELDGLRASVLVSNRGPGFVDLSFEHLGERSKTTRVQPNAQTHASLPCPLVVRLETGDKATRVAVSAVGVDGLRILGAPKPRN